VGRWQYRTGYFTLGKLTRLVYETIRRKGHERGRGACGASN